MENMRRYAGPRCEYRFDLNPNIASKLVDVAYYYEKLNPLLDDSFLEYDRILFVDSDIYAVDGLTENIFDVPIVDVGICTEPQQPELRAKLSGQICGANDERWASMVKIKYLASMPRDSLGRLKVYNTGLMLWTREGIRKARKTFAPFQEYVNAVRKAGLGKFYTIDQNYFHAMMVKYLDYTELDNGWNSYVHYIGPEQKPRPVNDSRNENTKFVHIQLRGADDFDADKLWRITNLEQSKWEL
jgi:hypothetical protein